ncbi:MAG: electron-transfer flavoprotein:ubiquinone oxidoreductase [Gemmatimonadales bacterium]|nr:electron-transfer flavoprotein:ubiquinone oxidoreductase [Gemmatimonadales bacterium]
MRFLPITHQPSFDPHRYLRAEPPSDEAIPLDVCIVGAGPAGLACAIELARLGRAAAEAGEGAELAIGVLEKAAALGEHSLSGAVVNPRVFRTLFPDVPEAELPFRQRVSGEAVYLLTAGGATRLPTPPTMRNHGNHCASLSEMVRWLGERAEGLGVNLFTGFPADALLTSGTAVAGVRTAPSGLGRDGTPGDAFTPATDLTARVTVLAEGTRGPLAQAWRAWQGVSSDNPQLFALGVKEVWKVRRPLDRIIHTMGWPLGSDTFGGSWCYPMGPEHVSIGLVAGLDSHDAGLDVHERLQRLKLHPLFRAILEGGELVEWGAKTIPEGGWYALPQRLSGDGIVMVGDTVGLVDVPSLKGIHYAMESGVLAARAIHRALAADDPSAARLAAYDAHVRDGWVGADLRRTRNMRLAFKDGFWAGAVKAGLMTLTGGAFPGGRIAMDADAASPRTHADHAPFTPDGVLAFSKVDAVFKSGNRTRDDAPSHLVVGRDIPAEVADFYARLCPAGVYEREGETLRVNPPNCVDCKATDVLGPRWTPREGGSGPAYRMM